MTVDFPPPYPASVPPASKPVDVQTLQDTFAALLRSYGAEKGGTQTDTILEVIRPNQSDTDEKDRNQQRQDTRQHSNNSTITQTERKLLDKSEIRKEEMSADYQNRTDRHEMLRNDYQEKIAHSELPPSAVRMDSATPSSAEVQSSEPVPHGNHSPPPQQRNVSEKVDTNNPVPAVNVATPSGSAISGQPNVVMPVSLNTPVSMPTSVASPSAPPQTFTVFTPSGRLGQPQEKADENEDEKEDRDEEKEGKKKTPFVAFETIRLETTRPIHRTPSRQPKESPSAAQVPRTPGKSHAKLKEVKPESSRSVKTIDDLLHAPIQDIAVPKKGESPPDQAQYIKRIAAACEATSQYAPIRLKINLEHLGTLTLRFFYKADRLMLRFDTPSKESAQFLRNNLDGLRAVLAKRNVKIAEMEIVQE